MTIEHYSNSSYGIGIDIGGTKTLIIIADDQGRVAFRDRLKTTNNLDALVNMIKESITNAEIPGTKLAGMGMGIPGRINHTNGYVIDVPALKWENLNLLEVLQGYFDLPIFINNDVNLALAGERWLGNGKDCDDLFYMSIGTGIGGAIVANGKVVSGSSFSAGEIGYFIDKDDIRKGSRNLNQEFGTFEAKNSGTYLAQKGLPFGFSPPELFREYSKDNPEVIPVMEDFILNISIAIANVVSLLNPEIVIIGGGVSESMPVVLEKITEKVADFTPIKTRIVLSGLGSDAAALGGVAWVFRKVDI